METQNNVQKSWRTRQEKEELIVQWQQSGMSRKEFCQEKGITYPSDQVHLIFSKTNNFSLTLNA